MSVWIKISKILSSSEHMGIMGTNDPAGYGNAGASQIGFYNGGFYVWVRNSSGSYFKEDSTRLFRDPNAWYHIVIRLDSTQSTASDRIKAWVNNEEITAWSNTGDLPQNTPVNINGAYDIRVGRYTFTGGGHNYFDGSMSHFHLCDGQTYSPSDFGETDNTTGEWKIKTSPSVTYGTNGFTILKDGNTITDQSANSNNFTVGGGTLTKTEDNPSNVFATLNPLFYSPDVTLSNGNTTVVEASNNWRSGYSQIGVSKGKWYWETQLSYQAGTEGYIGIAHEDHMNGYDVTYGNSSGGAGAPNRGGYDYVGYSTKSLGIYSNGNQDYPSTITYTGAFNASTYVMGLALDVDNRKLYISRNGIWTNASNNDWGSATFNASTGDIDISSKIPASGFIFPAVSPNESTFKMNFGNGYFGSTAISSPQQDDAGIGNFQYSPPTGYYAICTKNINTYG